MVATFMREMKRYPFSLLCFVDAAGDMPRLFSHLFLFHAHAWASEPVIFFFFLNPLTGGPIPNYTQDPVYKFGETVQLRWTTYLDSFSIIL